MLSWSMVMMGAISFASCGDDDDDDDDNNNGGSALYDQYKGYANGAVIDGDNVVYKAGSSILVYHFDGDKCDKVSAVADYGTEAAANAAYNQLKESGEDMEGIEVSGSVLSYSETVGEEYASMTKEQLVKVLNGDFSDIMDF